MLEVHLSISEDPGSMEKFTLITAPPKNGTSIPTAKKNHKGRIVSDPGELRKLLGKEVKIIPLSQLSHKKRF